MDLLKELEWRGLLENSLAGTSEVLNEEPQKVYIGFDPTAPSLTIGNLLAIKILVHVQRAGHQPIALVGGATGLVGDPSGRSAERPFLDENELRSNAEKIEKQLRNFLDFESKDKPAFLLNNLDWLGEIKFLEFLRETGKHLTVNYMMAKDSVKNRMEEGISFTEFSYQLLQGHDFYHLYKNHNCKIQSGGSDQFGNITTGAELIRRKLGKQAYGFVCPLLTREDGTKFGKSEGKNLWLDPELTSPYAFYQFWINCTDKEASRYIRVFTFLEEEEIRELEKSHEEAPHKRALQTRLAEEVTTWVHGKEELNKAIEATRILFGKNNEQNALLQMDESLLLSALEGVEQYEISLQELENGIPAAQLLAEKTGVFESKGEVRRMIKNGGLKINKNTVQSAEEEISTQIAIKSKYLLVQKGRKNYFLIYAS